MSNPGLLPRVIVLVGLPGSGKSTWAAQQGYPTLSSDALRLLLADSETDQTIHARVFRALRFLLRERIAIGRPVTCVDATSLTRKERLQYRRISGCQLEAVWFDTPVEMCKARNRARQRQVPEHVIDAMATKLQPPTKEEGFSSVTVIRP